MNTTKNILGGTILVALIALIIYLVGAYSGNPETFDKSQWKTYTSQDLGIELRYPETQTAWPSGTNMAYFQEGNVTLWDIQKIQSDSSLQDFKYLGFNSKGTVKYGNVEYMEFQAPKGYCENNICGRPFEAFAAKQGNGFLMFTFYGSDRASLQEKAILGTIKFN